MDGVIITLRLVITHGDGITFMEEATVVATTAADTGVVVITEAVTLAVELIPAEQPIHQEHQDRLETEQDHLTDQATEGHQGRYGLTSMGM
jgi:hypothetical protein